MSTVVDHAVQTGGALLSRELVAEATMAFHFSKPEGFSFKAGQAVDLALPGVDARHAFSIVSAPFEDEIVLATRMRPSAYKQALGSLGTGATVAIEGPFGSLTLHRKRERDALFIAGGIGITPFVSILRQAFHDGDERRFVLLYSNRGPRDAAFLDELRERERAHGNFGLFATMTDVADGRPIDGAMIREAASGLSSPIAYVAGPPAMVAAMRTALAAAGIDEDDVRVEDFAGY